MKKNLVFSWHDGFTLTEIIIVSAITLTLLGLTLASSITFHTSTLTTTTSTTLTTDLKNQQTKAMVGDTEGRGTPDNYGIHIDPTKYTLFHGSIYSPADPANFDIPMDSIINLTTTFVGNDIVFATNSGEIQNLSSGHDTITIIDMAANKQINIQLNKFGAVVSMN